MEITSGGTPGPRLDGELAVLDNNVYGLLRDLPDASRIAQLFAGSGWRARSSSFTAYEVEREWACLELQQLPDGVMFSGVVDPARVDELGGVLTGLGLRYTVELWDPAGTEMLRELVG
ncbi:hypothetical protein [Actinoplanes sp. DH11]|uniref:hypothetical protein n=1 Tax=Actinoplanes sp. DH11 TaxID=2857011 RepID=UPI001E2B7F6E|nr:hypothetical protein [Actinoplanes sp. DH11]